MNSENFNDEINEKKKNVVQARKPLSDLCENVVQGGTLKIHQTHKSVSAIIVSINKVQLRSSSTSTVETKKITFCDKRENYKGLETDVDDEVFEDDPASKNLGCTSQKSTSEGDFDAALSVASNARPNTEKTETRRPAQKTTLVRKLSHRCKRKEEDDLYDNYLYEEYMEENYLLSLTSETNFVYKKACLKLNIDSDHRMIIVNWLNYAHQIYHLHEATYFKTIRIFDYILLKTKPSNDQYILIATSCMWINSKFFDIPIELSQLSAICKGKFLRERILRAEKEILKLLKFDLNFPEPLASLSYYLKLEKRENEPNIRYSAMFLLEVSTLLLDFSSLTPSLLASFALLLVYSKYGLNFANFLGYIDDHLLDKDLVLRKLDQLKQIISKLLQCKNLSNEIVTKYSKKERYCVALNFI